MTAQADLTRQVEYRVSQWVDADLHGGVTAYRVWRRFTAWGVEQVHQYRMADGTTSLDRQGWIRGYRGEVANEVAMGTTGPDA